MLLLSTAAAFSCVASSAVPYVIALGDDQLMLGVAGLTLSVPEPLDEPNNVAPPNVALTR